MKIVINACYGGFGLSKEALKKLNMDEYKIKRNDPLLIKIIEELGEKANGNYANLKIIEIPDDVEYEIEEYDGWEWISEKHRIWR